MLPPAIGAKENEGATSPLIGKSTADLLRDRTLNSGQVTREGRPVALSPTKFELRHYHFAVIEDQCVNVIVQSMTTVPGNTKLK